jgi:dihydrofolate reductase
MGKITVVNNITLDGVMQAPARPDEDPRGGFARGGWAIPYQDSVIAQKMGAMMASGEGSLLLGRRTYEDFFSVWPKRTDNPFYRTPQQSSEICGLQDSQGAPPLAKLDPAERGCGGCSGRS